MRARTGALLALVAALAVARADERPPLEDLQASIAPDESELAWSRLGWLTDPWAARAKASALGRPIFLWEMDGHPLA